MTAIFLPLAEQYKAETGVSIEYVFIPYGEYETTLGTRLSGDNPPDAGWVVERNGPAFIDAGVLYDIGPTLKGDAEYDYADFSVPASAQWVVGDAVYGVPFSTSPFITIFNKDLFAAAGLDTPDVLEAKGEWTWEALRSAAKAIADQTDAWGFVGNDGGAAMYSAAPWGTVMPALRAYGADTIMNNAVCHELGRSRDRDGSCCTTWSSRIAARSRPAMKPLSGPATWASPSGRSAACPTSTRLNSTGVSRCCRLARQASAR